MCKPGQRLIMMYRRPRGVTQQQTGVNPSERGCCTVRRPGHLQHLLHGARDGLHRPEPGPGRSIRLITRVSDGNLPCF